QQITSFVSAAGRRDSPAIFYPRSNWYVGFSWDLGPFGWHHLNQKGLLIGHPCQAGIEYRVELYSIDAVYLCTGKVANPQFNRIVGHVPESEHRTSCVQGWRTGSNTRRKRNWNLGAIRKFFERKTDVIIRAMQCIITGIDPD